MHLKNRLIIRLINQYHPIWSNLAISISKLQNQSTSTIMYHLAANMHTLVTNIDLKDPNTLLLGVKRSKDVAFKRK